MLGQEKFYKKKYENKSIGEIWEGCTSSFNQFLVRYSQNPLHDGEIETQSSTGANPSSTGCIPLKGIGTEPSKNTIQAQTVYFFERPYLTECERTVKEKRNPPGLEKARALTHEIKRRFHELPLRLTFVTDPTSPPSSHTATDITIEYYDWKCEKRRAKYRWLGGIYPIKSGNSFRYVLFWSDHKRHEIRDKGKLRKYAPHECDWRITGGFEFKDSERSERVPLSEWQNGRPALLFYEKVLGPEEREVKGVLQAAKVVKFARPDPVIKSSESQTRPKSSSQTVGVPVVRPPQGVTHPIDYPKAAISSEPTNPQTMPPPEQPGPTQRGPLQSSRAQPAQTTGARQALQYPGDSGRPRQGILAGQAPLLHTSGHHLSGYQWLGPPQQGQIDRPSMSGTQMSPPEYFGGATNILQEFGLSNDNVEFASPSKPFSPECTPDSSRVSTRQAHEHGEALDNLLTSYPTDPSGLGFYPDDPTLSPYYPKYTNVLQPMEGMFPQPGHAQPNPEHAAGELIFSSEPATSIPPLPDTGSTPLPSHFEDNYFAGGGLPASHQAQGTGAFCLLQEHFDMCPGDAPLPQGPGARRGPAKRKESPEYEPEQSSAPRKKQRK